MAVNRWSDVDHALAYLARADEVPHRTEGEAVLLELLPERIERFVDLGCGDGRLTALVLAARPAASVVALDFSDHMLGAARQRFAGDDRVAVVAHDLETALDVSGPVDAVVSSFAIHHVGDERKRALDREAFAILRPGGAFLNLEHVDSPTEALHHAFLATMDIDPDDDDPSNQLAPVGDQLAWLREAGFSDVDCHWKWRELALLAGVRPA